MQWHQDGLTPYIVFAGRVDHGDAGIRSAQKWLNEYFSVANPVERVIKHPRLVERTFKRITWLPPGAYRKRFRMPDFATPTVTAQEEFP